MSKTKTGGCSFAESLLFLLRIFLIKNHLQGNLCDGNHVQYG
jgi:hypothetical protein